MYQGFPAFFEPRTRLGQKLFGTTLESETQV